MISINMKKIHFQKPELKTILFSIVDIILVLAIIFSYYLTFEVHTKRVIFIPKGSTTSTLKYLDNKTFNINYIDKIVLTMVGQPQSGWIDLKSKYMTKMDFLYKLTTSKAALKKITLIPGETYYFFLQELADKLNISTTKLFDIYSNLAYKKDGNIIADTYYLPLGMDETQLISHLLKITENRYKKLSLKIFGIYNNKNWYRYITIASIIQKESASKQEMPKISSVIYNRLNKPMKLQMDGVLNYGKYSHTKIKPKIIKDDTSEYNTYKYKGLPKNPVCAVALSAIKAAIFPAKSNYLYFVKSLNGKKHNFTSSYKVHKRNISKLRKYNRKQALKKKRLLQKNKKKKIVKKSIRKKVIKKKKRIVKKKIQPKRITKQHTSHIEDFKPIKTTINMKDLWK